MSGREVIATVLMGSGVAIQVLGCLGVAAMRDVFDRIHFGGVSGYAATLIAAGLLVEEGFSLIADKALLLAAFLLITSPVLAHATGRAARIRERGDAGVGDDPDVEVLGR